MVQSQRSRIVVRQSARIFTVKIFVILIIEVFFLDQNRFSYSFLLSNSLKDLIGSFALLRTLLKPWRTLWIHSDPLLPFIGTLKTRATLVIHLILLNDFRGLIALALIFQILQWILMIFRSRLNTLEYPRVTLPVFRYSQFFSGPGKS